MRTKSAAAFALGPTISAVLSFATVPLLAWHFSLSAIGQLNLLQTLLSFGIPLIWLGLDQALVREYHLSANRSRLMAACSAPALLALIVASVIALPLAPAISRLLFDSPTWAVGLATVAAAWATFFLRLPALVLRMQERGIAFATSLIIPKLGILVMFCLMAVVGLPASFLTLAATVACATAVAALICGYLVRQSLRAMFESRDFLPAIAPLLSYGLPLALASLAYAALAASGPFSLRLFSSLEEVGIYAVAMNFAGVALVFQAIFTVLWAPTVYKWSASGTEELNINRVLRPLFAVAALIVGLVGMFSWVPLLILPSEYDAIKFMIPCCIGQPILYSLSEVTGIGINLSRRTLPAVIASASAFVVSLALNAALAPPFGARGTAAATFVSFGVFFVIRSEASAAVWRRLPLQGPYILLSLSGLIAVCSAVAGDELGPTIWVAWAIYLAAVMIAYRAELRSLTLGAVRSSESVVSALKS